jgi:hypothetical protein
MPVPFDVLHVPAHAVTLDDCTRETITGITDLQRLVGGYVEQFPVPASDSVIMYGDEEGLIKDSPTNTLAACILDRYATRAGTHRVQRIVGDVVFAAYDPRLGEQDVPDSFIRDLQDHLPRTPVE